MASNPPGHYPEVNVDLPVEVTCGEKTSRERATTLGGGGMFLAITTPLAPGTEIRVRFRPAKHLPVFEARARVLSQIPERGTAVEFTQIDPQQQQALLRLILHRRANRRKFARARLVTQVECEQFTELAFSRDVSEGGMFIETKRPLPVDSTFTLRFNLDDGKYVVVALAEVMYEVVDLGMGVQFSGISQEDRKRIVAYVSRSGALPDPTGGTAPA
jgi:c-di-GMP-binding flagellar brake protein YcgR